MVLLAQLCEPCRCPPKGKCDPHAPYTCPIASPHALKFMPGHSYTTHISRYLDPDLWPESMIFKHWNRYFNIAICRYIEIDICEKWLSIDISGHMANISAISDNIGCYQEGPRGDHFVVKVVHFHYISTISLPFCILIFEPISVTSFFIETLAWPSMRTYPCHRLFF
jgi:hypothetical protein